MRPRNYIFLKDVASLSLTAFGGPQAHVAMMLQLLVERRRYINEKELLELNALCNILPGPSSTQTITAIGFKIGGPNLAYLTLLVWIAPAALIMIAAAVLISFLGEQGAPLGFTRFIQPMAVGFVAFAAYRISSKVVTTKLGIVILMVSAILAYFFRSPWVFPVLLLAGGSLTAFRFSAQPILEKKPMKVEWANFVLFLGVFVGAALLGRYTQLRAVLLFENFYRNGSLIFGGGQVLIPLMYTEFVEFKHYLSSKEFLSGFAMVQALPGPVFSFCSYIGTLSMRNYGITGQLIGGVVSTIAIFLPGTFLIFFVIRFWEELRKYRVIQASLEGINAVGSGMVCAAAIMLYHPIENTPYNFGLVVVTFALLLWTKIPAPALILVGLVVGLLFPN
ncbi:MULTISPECIES: chromate efflux transporter [Rufibacter]|uniref:Chromate transporter n=1 Tax=Rufibacter quisquiliarum TaxID=1549639 RepID=A0A839GFU4_9BACT|nr:MULTISPECIES: chromate efflux transporter [Rufibacter]MBA9078524.1 chromate transporter [Rufibacter quisquiliarum]